MATVLWTKEQLKLAYHLYCQLPFGKLHSRNKEIVQLASLIGRTPGAVAMKLVNFASLDPKITGSGRRGLGNASDLDREVWSEFHADWDLEQLTIKICDFGVGLPPELLEFAGKQPVVSKKRGLGVGLFLTYSTINRLGGKINLYNRETGGACVEITLPLLTTEA